MLMIASVEFRNEKIFNDMSNLNWTMSWLPYHKFLVTLGVGAKTARVEYCENRTRLGRWLVRLMLTGWATKRMIAIFLYYVVQKMVITREICFVKMFNDHEKFFDRFSVESSYTRSYTIQNSRLWVVRYKYHLCGYVVLDVMHGKRFLLPIVVEFLLWSILRIQRDFLLRYHTISSRAIFSMRLYYSSH